MKAQSFPDFVLPINSALGKSVLPGCVVTLTRADDAVLSEAVPALPKIEQRTRLRGQVDDDRMFFRFTGAKEIADTGFGFSWRFRVIFHGTKW